MSAEGMALAMIALNENETRELVGQGQFEVLGGTPLEHEETVLLRAVANEDYSSRGFRFAGSNTYRAVHYVRTRKSELSDSTRQAFGRMVIDSFGNGAGGAVQSGCVRGCGSNVVMDDPRRPAEGLSPSGV